MGKSLIITEKPSVAQEFAKVLHVSGRGDGFIENNEYVITWCVGHLVGMVYPESYDMKYKKWKLEDLPFLPRDYKYDVISNVRKQYEIVHGMLQREDIDRVYWAGDAGKEGQTIEENIRNYGGVRAGMEELRVWIDSQTEEEILRGIREAKPMSAYANLGNSGIMRTIEDYAMGINFSRVMSVKYGNLLNSAANTSSYTAIAVGRVMTCVLGMVVIREREIRNFKETPFYRVVGNFTEAGIEGEWKAVEGSKYFESPLLYKENGFKESKDAKALIDELNGLPALVKSIEKTLSKKRAPLLFNLAELQAECSKRFKISPDQTLQVAQELYEKKLTTYPRTDARVLSTAVAKEIYKNISRLKGFEPTAQFVDQIMSKKLYANIANTSYTDDSKVTDHYAIIPTGQLTELNSLNSLQRSVFTLIVRRFLSIFYPPAVYQNVKLVVEVEAEKKEDFFASAKVLKEPGYLEIAGIPKKKDNNDPTNPDRGLNRVTGGALNENPEEESEEAAPDPTVLLALADQLKNGDEISVQGYAIRDGKTSPPKRYTSGSMVLAMENAGQLIEDEELREQIKGSGIGTSATRAEIIQKLVRIGYLNLNQKTQILSPQNLGEMIFEVVNMTVPVLLNPQMTASWEKGLDGITQGTVQFDSYRAKLEEFIRKETEKMIGEDLKAPIADRISEFAGKGARGLGARRKIGVKCPVCGAEIVTTPFGFGCSNYKSDKTGCNFNIGEIAGKELTDEQVKELIEKGQTGTIRGFQSKTGKKFDACLKLNKDETTGKVSAAFDFEHVEPLKLNDIQCPICGGDIVVTPYGYQCVNHQYGKEGSCDFSIGKIADKNLSEVQIRELILEGRTETIRGFKSKNGKKFDACLTLVKGEDGKVNIQFDFEKAEAKVIKDVKCPDCGGDIVTTSFGFGCSNYSRDREDSCGFSIGKIADKAITEAQLKQLLTEGHTDTIYGFKSKAGKKFDACLKLVKEESRKTTVSFDFDHVSAKVVKDVKCPICGGDIVVTQFGFGCANYHPGQEDSCRFSVGKIADKTISEAQLKQLLTDGHTETIYGFKSKAGKKFDACLKLEKDDVGKTSVVFDFDHVEAKKVKDVKCPICGGDIVVTQFGFGCANYHPGQEDSCRFSIGKMAEKSISETQVKQLLTDGRTETIRGFKSKAGKRFDARVALNKDENGKVTGLKFDFEDLEAKKVKDVKCPVCGGEIEVTPFGFACSNHKKDDPESCQFMVGKIASVKIKEAQLKELLIRGKTDVITGFVAKTGMKFDAPLKLTEDGRITFDFPEKPKPVDTTVPCPKCGKMLTKSQWQYECECGFKVWHTVAKVPLTEEIIKELFTTGKTKNKVSGFTSKAGNVFDSCLKFENDTISFDFDNPGENQPAKDSGKSFLEELSDAPIVIPEYDGNDAKVPNGDRNDSKVLTGDGTDLKAGTGDKNDLKVLTDDGDNSKVPENDISTVLKEDRKEYGAEAEQEAKQETGQETEQEAEQEAPYMSPDQDDFFAGFSMDEASMQEEAENEQAAATNFLDEFAARS